MQKLTSQRALGIFAIVFSSLLWGTIPLILRQIDGSPFVKVFYRVFFSFLVLGIWLIVSGRWRTIKELDSFTIRWLLAQGALLAINWILFFGAFDRADVATVELLGYMGPVFVAMLAPFLLKYRFDKRIIIPLLLSLLGMLIVLVPHGLGFSSDIYAMIGAIMALASALTYALLIIMAKRILTVAPIDILTMFESMGASVLLLPFVLVSYRQGNVPTGGVTPYLMLFMLGAFHTAMTGVLFFYGLKQLRPEQAVIFTYVEPVSAIAFAMLFLGEPLTWFVVLGGILVVIGGTIVARHDAEEGIETTPIEAPTVEI
ncbi:MAG: DMT family transporter [Coriobacteriia bacterium]|nr:DMT family transporter [Coriobacteriia bacterium]